MYCLELAGTDDAFAGREAESAATGVEVVAPGVAVARGIEPERVRTLAYVRRASDLVGRTDASVANARALLDAAEIGREGTVAVRARDVRATTGASTREAERELGRVLVDRGFSVDLDDPDHELRALFSDGVCFLGWLDVESVRDFGGRKPTDRPFFQPGSMDPLDARALANIAGARPGATVLDPMCGTGGVLIEAGLVGARVVGSDAQRKMVRGARRNLGEYLDGAAARRTDRAPWDVLRGDATALPLCDDAVDGVAFDAPYGRQSKIARHDLRDLVAGALSEAARVAPRAVVVADRSWRPEAVDAGWRVEEVFERRVHRSLVRHVHVLERA
ncbi:THUMP domain-containing protein [Halegenticoccus tardaugens]|uniref:THUMP domain-containing protein n=1 Tax=Halegenticoccus tardaugens TaxID=2071624 RepID=UPI00100BD0D7|nr:THUMP domain-containing protein [Halegenticoccus tardaugens]